MRYTGLVLAAAAALLFTGCKTTTTSSSSYHVPAYRPANPGAVVIKVSLSKQNVYVMEGDRPLLVTATNVGKSGHETPVGTFRVLDKQKNKRSSQYGFWVKGDQAIPGSRSQSPGPGWHYEGYPMAYWVRFHGGYGFHHGCIWPEPRTHGCLRLHPNVVASFYELAAVGTPVIIAHSLPEDETLGRNVPRPKDYADPDPPTSYLLSERFFEELPPAHLQ